MNIKDMIEQYKSIGLNEQTKTREVLQQIALLALSRGNFFEKAAFYGGTALRILFGLDRFSEDLDFTLLKPDKLFHFESHLECLKREMASFGFELEVLKKAKSIETNIMSAFLKMNTLKFHLVLGQERRGNHNEKIQIKLEIDTSPPSGFRVENQLVTNPTSFYVLTLHKSDLFAGKIHAALFRNWKTRIKGRDWYDLIWYIENKVPLNLNYLQSWMWQSGNLAKTEVLDEKKVRTLIKNRIENIDWESAKNDVKPFIFHSKKLEIWSETFFTKIVDHLMFE